MKVFKNDQWQLIAQILVTVLLFRYVLFQNLIADLALSDIDFILFLSAIGIISVGGMYLYRIIRQEENPHRQIIKNAEKAYYYYLGFNVLGIGISFFVADSIEKTYYFGFFLGFAAVLYLYVTQWRTIVLFNNIVFAFITTFSVFLFILVDLLPSLERGEKINGIHETLLHISLQLASLLWLLIFIKTIVQDLIFINYDKRRNRRTLATLHGREKGAKRTTLLSLFPLSLIILFALYHWENYPLLIGYIIVVIILPLLFFLFRLWNAKESKDFSIADNILTAIIWLTSFSIVLLYFNFQ